MNSWHVVAASTSGSSSLPMMQWITAVVVTVAGLFAIFALLRRRQLREKYAALWLGVGTLMLVVTAWPPVLSAAADMLGVTVPTNLLFFSALVLLLGVTLHLSFECSKLEGESQTLAEDLALLRLELHDLRVSLTSPADTPKGASDSTAVRSPSTSP